MTVASKVLRSGIARRILACYIAAALLPLAVTAFLSLDQVTSLLREQSHTRLARIGEDYANSLRDRLLAVEERLHELSRRHDLGGTQRDADQTRLQREFKAIGIVDDAGRITAILGGIDEVPAPDAAQAERLARGGTILASAAGAKGATRLFASTRLRDDATGKPAHRGRDRSRVPLAATDGPVDAHGHLRRRRERQALLLHAGGRADRAPGVRVADAGRGLRPRVVRRSGVTYLASHHPLVLEAGIGGPRLVRRRHSPRPRCPRAGRRAESMLLAMAAMGALIVAVLSVTQICRTLRSLDELEEGARRVADKDFSARVEVEGDDEFGRLALSFNTMAARPRPGIHRVADARQISTRPSCRGSISTG